MPASREHVISLVLTDEEWRAFLQIHPQPVPWLRERILEELKREPSTAGTAEAVA